MALHEFQATHFNQLLPPTVLLLDLKGALWVFSHKASFTHDEMSTKRIVEVEISFVSPFKQPLRQSSFCAKSNELGPKGHKHIRDKNAGLK